MSADLHTSLLGCLLGTGVGDALGLPMERLSRRRIAAAGSEVRHRFFLGRGMFSDDTEHTLMLAAALVRHREEVARFRRAFAWKLRWWMLALPPGVGMGTARAIVRLWLGFPSSRSGVRSAGNGAAMRSGIIGVLFRDDPVKRREFALAACRVTHRDPRAEESALLVTEACALASLHASTEEVMRVLERDVVTEEMKSRYATLTDALAQGVSVLDYAAQIGCGHGVSGFAPNTVAVALYAWLRHRPQFGEAIRSVIACGGDTDTVAAITGAICGAETGESAIPASWVEGICDQPRSVGYIRELAKALAERRARAPFLWWPLVPVRNLGFLLIVLGHVVRRLFPPY